MRTLVAVLLAIGAAALAGVLAVWSMAGEAPEPPAAARTGTGRACTAPAEPPRIALAADSSEAARDPVERFPDGRIWLRLVGPPLPRNVAFAWADDEQRVVEPTLAEVEPADGWWKVDVPRQADGQIASLGVTADRCAVTWLRSPSPGERHEISLQPLEQWIAVLDIETGLPIQGADVRLSAADLTDAPWQPKARPGPDPDRAIHHAIEVAPGAYVVDGDLPARDLAYELRHATWQLAPSAPSTLSPDPAAGPLRVLAQMPLVAMVRYVGDERLDGSFQLSLDADRTPRAVFAGKALLASLTERHGDAVGLVVFPAVGTAGAGRRLAAPVSATAKAWFRHGARREDQVPLVRLSDFVEPTVVGVERLGREIVLQKVFIAPPPKVDGMQITFWCGVTHAKLPFRLHTKMDETLELPCGDYQVAPLGGWAGDLEPIRYSVRPGEDTTFQLAWKHDLVFYTVRAEVPAGRQRVQVRYATARGFGVSDAPITKEGLFVFATRRTIDEGTAYAKNCVPVPITFHPTRDPRVRTGSCVLRPQPK